MKMNGKTPDPPVAGYAEALAQSLRREQAKQAALDRLRHTFLSAVNHEIRTPLALLFQAIEMLEDPRFGTLTEEQLDALMIVRRQAQSLGRMFEGLTRVAAFLGKQGPVRPVWARLEPVFEQVLPLAEFKARGKEIALETDIAPDLPALPLDVKEMAEVLSQLLDNAIKFNQPGGTVKVTARAGERAVILTVADTGRGIAPEMLAVIWDLFEQGSDPVRRAREGLGLGLGLARYIVEAHHGTIAVETTLGQGSVFTVTLPRQQHRSGLSSGKEEVDP